MNMQDLTTLRRTTSGQRRRVSCLCGHLLYFHKIDSGVGQCFTMGCPCLEVRL